MTDMQPRPYWTGISDDDLRAAAAEYRQHPDDTALAFTADAIDDDLMRRAIEREDRADTVRIYEADAEPADVPREQAERLAAMGATYTIPNTAENRASLDAATVWLRPTWTWQQALDALERPR